MQILIDKFQGEATTLKRHYIKTTSAIWHSDVNATCEYLCQRISAYTCRSKCYEAKWRVTKQNEMFKHQKQILKKIDFCEEKWYFTSC